MKLGAEFDNCTWFGRGPRENYSDRKTGSDVGLWKSSVDDMAEFYVRPQENGCRSDVRWAAFTGKDGRGVLFSFPKPLFVTATRYEWEDLDFVRHRGGHATGGANNRRTARPFAEPRDEIVLNIDAAQMGLGNGCLGPRPLASYMLVTRRPACALRRAGGGSEASAQASQGSRERDEGAGRVVVPVGRGRAWAHGRRRSNDVLALAVAS